jgi:tetratricopeptide (TPR) repeat protein
VVSPAPAPPGRGCWQHRREPFPFVIGDLKSPVHGQLLPEPWRAAQLRSRSGKHALAVTGHAEALDFDLEAVGWLLNEAGLYLWQRADHRHARALFERALSIREARLGADHSDTARSINALASVLHAQGDLDNARGLHERALAIREARLGTDHPDTATSLNNLARVLADQGDLEAARTLVERSLAIYEQRLGTDHPDTVRSRQDLAAVVAALDT